MKQNTSKSHTALGRQKQILELLKHQEQVSNDELAAKFGVTEMTIRRDLSKLADSGQIQRTHGGAMAAERMIFEFDFAARRASRQKEKRAIAREAVKFIQPGHSLILDNGTTILELAYLLRSLEGITVFTPSLAVGSVLQFARGVKTVLLGGVISAYNPTLTGAVTETNLKMFSVDIAFQGTDGIGLDGTLYAGDMDAMKIDQMIRRRAARSYLLSDSSKIGKNAMAINGQLHDVNAFITDDKIRQEDRRKFEALGAKIIIVKS